MTQKINSYGIKTITVNNQPIHTYNVVVNNNPANLQIIKDSRLNHVCISGRKGDKIQITHTTMSTVIFQNEVKVLGRALKKIALANVEHKYSWTER